MYALLAEHRHRLFPGDILVDLFPSGRGRPSQPADLVATVLVLRSLEGLSDRPERIFDAVREVIAETNVLANKTARALDSTLLDDAVMTQGTVRQLVSMNRRVRRAVPQAGAAELVGDDYETSSGEPQCAWNDPAARDELVTRLLNDAVSVLEAVDGAELDDDQTQLVGLLALVAGQDVEPGDEEGTWRIERGVAKHRAISTVDPEFRHMHKSRSSYRDGYKAHIAVEPGTRLITACDLTPANAGDGPTGVALLADEPVGIDVRADSADGSGDDQFAATTSRSTTPPAASPAPTVSPPTSATPASPRSKRSLEAAPSDPMHLSHRRQDVPRHRARPAAGREPAPMDERQRPRRRLPTTPADGRTIHCLARRRQPPPLPTPRRRAQPPRPQHPSRRHQPRRLLNPGPDWNNGWQLAT